MVGYIAKKLRNKNILTNRKFENHRITKPELSKPGFRKEMDCNS